MSPANAQSQNVAQCLSQAQTLGLARADAQMMLLHCLDQALHDRAWLMTHDANPLTDSQKIAWQKALTRRLQGEPVAYITGHKDFFGLTLHLDARVLDPRPDTETLVEWALELLPPTAVSGCSTWAPAAARWHWRCNTNAPTAKSALSMSAQRPCKWRKPMHCA